MYSTRVFENHKNWKRKNMNGNNIIKNYLILGGKCALVSARGMEINKKHNEEIEKIAIIHEKLMGMDTPMSIVAVDNLGLTSQIKNRFRLFYIFLNMREKRRNYLSLLIREGEIVKTLSRKFHALMQWKGKYGIYSELPLITRN
jgi:hypothetical protein